VHHCFGRTVCLQSLHMHTHTACFYPVFQNTHTRYRGGSSVCQGRRMPFPCCAVVQVVVLRNQAVTCGCCVPAAGKVEGCGKAGCCVRSMHTCTGVRQHVLTPDGTLNAPATCTVCVCCCWGYGATQ
jgi:hypothetical protein